MRRIGEVKDMGHVGEMTVHINTTLEDDVQEEGCRPT